MQKKVDRLCSLVVRVPGYTTEMYCVRRNQTLVNCPRLGSITRHTDWLIVSRNVTLTLIDRLCGLVVRVPGYHNGDVLCFLWGTNWIYICYVEESRPPLWSSDQSSWPQIQISGVRFPSLPDFLRSSGSGTGSTQPRESLILLSFYFFLVFHNFLSLFPPFLLPLLYNILTHIFLHSGSERVKNNGEKTFK
jgi:hypothetical protein